MIKWSDFQKKSEESTNIRLMAKITNYYYNHNASK